MKGVLKQANAGFTMVEMIVVIAIVGILAAIAAPSWLALLTRQRVNAAQAEALAVLRQAQANSKREKREWQTCFRDDGTKVMWSVTSATDKCNTVPTASWNNLVGENSDTIAIDTTNTNLPDAPSGYYRVIFQYKGLVSDGASTRITFRSRVGSATDNSSKRCVRVETLLGAMSTAQNNECNF